MRFKDDSIKVIHFTRNWIHYGFLTHTAACVVIAGGLGVAGKNSPWPDDHESLDLKVKREIVSASQTSGAIEIKQQFLQCVNRECVRAIVVRIPTSRICGWAIFKAGGKELKQEISPEVVQQDMDNAGRLGFPVCSTSFEVGPR